MKAKPPGNNATGLSSVVITLDDRIKDGKHNDSFWYDGLVMMFVVNKTEYSVRACGQIDIRNKEGELVHNGYEQRNSGLPFKLKEDEDLQKLEPNGFYWRMNNWFVLEYEEVWKGHVLIDDTTVFHSLKELDGIIEDLKKEVKA